MSEPEIERIKARHQALRAQMYEKPHLFGETIRLDGARPAQLGLGTPLIDDLGRLWRWSSDQNGEIITFMLIRFPHTNDETY